MRQSATYIDIASHSPISLMKISNMKHACGNITLKPVFCGCFETILKNYTNRSLHFACTKRGQRPMPLRHTNCVRRPIGCNLQRSTQYVEMWVRRDRGKMLMSMEGASTTHIHTELQYTSYHVYPFPLCVRRRLSTLAMRLTMAEQNIGLSTGWRFGRRRLFN